MEVRLAAGAGFLVLLFVGIVLLRSARLRSGL